MAVIRHLFMYNKKFTKKVVAIWLTISVCINFYFANTLTDLFPLIATIQFTFMAKKQNTLWLKYAQIVNTLIWSIYHIAHITYIYLLFDIILLIVSIVRILKGVEE